MTLFLQFVPLAVFTFGAPAFSVLAFSYWRQGHGHGGSIVFRIFTVICAAAFLGNLIATGIFIDYPSIVLTRALLGGLLPPMMAHLILEQEPNARLNAVWRAFLYLLYLAAILSALAGESPWSDEFENSSLLVLGACSLFSLTILLINRRDRPSAEYRQRNWNLGLFSALLLSAIAAVISENPFFRVTPDYLLLLFFAIRLYYTERLAFFDRFVKGGVYVVTGAVVLTFLLLIVPSFRNVLADDWLHAWLGVLALMPVWFLGPPLYSRLGHWVDWALHRKYSDIQAERLFMQEAQASGSEEELRDLAVISLQEIFQCSVQIDFDHKPSSPAPGDLICAFVPAGQIRLLARDNQIPFLSADRRLLETLAATLGVLLQNVRLRSQQQDQLRREQELASLASRAELRALRAQINPHFLFNALNAIAGWIRTEPEFADDTVAQLAEVFRYTLQRAQNEWVRVHEEVDFIRAYLAVERARFGNRLRTDISVDPAANAIHIPAMVIQPLVENAIKHGVSQMASGKIALAVGLDGYALRIEVYDNGPGFPSGFMLENTTGGHGLRNVADRLKGYYGEGGLLRCENTSMGTRVTIKIFEMEHS